MWVYIHTFPNGKRYIGQTVQIRVKHRWGNGSQYKSTPYLFNAISKYGWDNIKHTVYKVDTVEEMDYLERYLIRYYNSDNKKYGYNIAPGGSKNKSQSEDTKRRISEKLGTAVVKMDLNGNIICSYPSIKAAAKDIKGSATQLNRVLKGKHNNIYRNYYWDELKWNIR